MFCERCCLLGIRNPNREEQYVIIREVVTFMFTDLLILVTVDLPMRILDACYKQSRYLGVVSYPS